MSRDWNIVDDSPDPEDAPSPASDERLDVERIHRIARARRAADRVKLWRVGLIVTALLAAAIVIARVAWHLTH